jgi:hypothetical protein
VMFIERPLTTAGPAVRPALTPAVDPLLSTRTG